MKITGVILLFLLFTFSVNEKVEINRFNTPAFKGKVEKIIPVIAEINDTIPNDTLHVYYTADNIPVKYSRKIITGVCIKGECRMVDIELFWNITGRYLGFRLPPGEFLSKTEHVKFEPKEYDRLHVLLNDHQSALANYRLDELVPEKDTAKQKVDALSTATIAAVLDYIVEGAVYTTYTLWHIIYGPTKREIERLTSEKMDSRLALKIFESDNIRDKVWCLNHISADVYITAELQSQLMKFILGEDVYLAERALNALKPELIDSDIQRELASAFKNAGFLQKRLILQKFKEVNNPKPEIFVLLTSDIQNLNGSLVKILLDLLEWHQINNLAMANEICDLLKNENRYIANNAYHFLTNANITDKKIQKQLEKYKKKN